MAEHHFSVEWLAWDIAEGNVDLLEDMTTAVMYDLHCIAGQLDYVNHYLDEGKNFDGKDNEYTANLRQRCAFPTILKGILLSTIKRKNITQESTWKGKRSVL